MIGAAVSSTTQTVSLESTRDADSDDRSAVRRAKVRRFVQGDYAPAVLLIAVIVALGAYIFIQNDRYLGAFNISSMLLLVSALGFIALGQTIALLTGGIDLSVGPLVGFLVVVGSFFVLDESPVASILFGFAAMLAVSIIVGLINGVLIRYVKFTAIAATLTVYIALQGMSFLVRPTAGRLHQRRHLAGDHDQARSDPDRLHRARPRGHRTRVRAAAHTVGLATAGRGL